MPRPLPLVTFTLLLLGAGMPSAAAVAPAGAEVAATTETAAAEQRYVVRFSRGTDAGREAVRLDDQGADVDTVLSRVFPGAVVQLPPAAADALRRSPRVTAVEEVIPISVTTTRNDVVWGLDRLDQRPLPLSGTFTTRTTGAGVTAFVVDTGVRADHVEFTGRVTSGYSVFPDAPAGSDCHGHGTHVAGTIGGATYGVAPGTRIVPVRVLDCTGGGDSAGLLKALDWVLANRPAGQPAVVNLSLGGGASTVIDDAVKAVHDAGVTVVTAAGNAGTDACGHSPGRAPLAITVGATQTDDARASYSNYGTCLDVFAPGSGIRSAWSGSSTATAMVNGTSMAAPHAAGAAALLLQRDPSLSPSAVAALLLDGATTGRVTDRGSGSPDRLLHLEAAPAAPTGVQAVAADASAVVSWTAPPAGDAAPASGYTVTASPGGTTANAPAGDRTVRVTGLTSGTPYTFTVVATSRAGAGAVSAPSASVTPSDDVAGYVTAVYRDLFGRDPDPAGLEHWTTQLRSGTPYGAVANGITYSREARTGLITQSYLDFLGREPDPAGLENWLDAMDAGLHVQQLQAGFTASPEYYQRAGSTDDGWVRALYRDVLNRTPADVEVKGWVDSLAAGAQRDQVALGFLYSREHLGTVVEGWYQRLLGRALEPAGRDSWVGALQAGHREEAIVAGIVSSDEYRTRASAG